MKGEISSPVDEFYRWTFHQLHEAQVKCLPMQIYDVTLSVHADIWS
jgi:hypothetical protein